MSTASTSQVEIAKELLSRARFLLYANIHRSDQTADEARYLDGKARELYTLWASLDSKEPNEVEIIVRTWQPLLNDESCFWQAMRGKAI